MSGDGKNDDGMFEEIFGEDGPFTGPDDPRLAQVAPMIIAMVGGDMPGGITADGQIGFHDNPQIVLPKGMGYREAYRILQRHERDSETPTTWSRTFNYRPDDGAHATREVLLRMFGMAMGESQEVGGFFGTQVIPSETRDIAIAHNKRVQVPWGMVTVPRLPGLELILASGRDPEYGRVFEVSVQGPRKYKGDVEAIFDAIEEELRTNSIYRGQALTGSDKLEFLDVSRAVDPTQIVFSDLVERTLNAKLWSVLRYADTVRQQGVPLKRSILLYGPYGTGKTSAGVITGQIAVLNGWTFLSAKTSDNVEDVLRTARLYQKAVVFFEDIDREGDTDQAGLAELLDAFDGITSKGGELIVVMTTNRYQDIPKGMLRPGRLDAVIEIAELDRGGTERLIKALVPAGKLDANIDYDAVYAAMDGYLPAFVREAVSSALLFAVDRLSGGQDYVITTDDLVDAAESLRSQFNAHNAAAEGTRQHALGKAMTETIQGALHGGVVDIPRLGRAKIVLDSDSGGDV